MTRCPDCGHKLGFRLMRGHYSRGYPAFFAFRCEKCGVKLGYPGWRDLVVTIFSLALAAIGVIPLALVLKLPPDLPLWLFGAAVLMAGTALFAWGLVCGALVAWLVPAERLPAEYQ